MDQLIRLSSTGSPAQFSNTLKISERTLFNYLSFLKDLGAKIYYNKNQNRYEYLNELELEIRIGYFSK